MRSCECIIWKDSETPPFESLSSSRHLYRDYFLHYSITSKAPFHLPKKYSISRKGRKAAEGFLGSSQNQERKSGIHQLLPKRDIEQTFF